MTDGGPTLMQRFSEKEAAARALEARLREVSRNARNFYDQPVRQLRARLRDAYADVLLEDPKEAQAHDIETALWKWVYYKPIEEFRHRVRFAADAGEKGEEPLRKVKAALLKFLEEATSFYLQLIASLQAAHGTIGLLLGTVPSSPRIVLHADQLPATEHSVVVVSIYRCLICLGDLARYQTNIPSSQSTKDWSEAENFYQTAARVYPAGGNAHNQLAVLATYRNDELSAVYHYFRSLAVAEPFLIARENLLLLFEQNRKRLESLGKHTASARHLAERHGPHPSVPGIRANEPLDALFIRFVRLQGILFTKINLDTFAAVYDDVLVDLAAALADAPTLRALVAPGRHATESALLQLTVMTVFSMYEADVGSTEVQLRYAEALQQAEVLRYANMTAYSISAQLLRCLMSAASADQDLQQQDVMAPLQLLLCWFADRKVCGMSEAKDNRELTAYLQFWKAAEEYLQTSCRRTAPHVHAALQELATPLGPSVAEDLQLVGFRPLQHRRNGNDSMPSTRQAGGMQRAVCVITALLRSRPHANECSVSDCASAEQSALAAAAQLFCRACDEAVRLVGTAEVRPAEPAPPVGGVVDGRGSGGSANMEFEEVIVFAPPAAVLQPAPVPAQTRPAAMLDEADDVRQGVPAHSQSPAQAGQLPQAAVPQDAKTSGVDEVDTPQHDADVGAEHDPVGAGKTDAATYEAREHSPAQAPAAQPLERPHGMLGWDLFENARASTGFSAFFGGGSAVGGSHTEPGQASAKHPRAEGGNNGQDWSWLDDLAD